MNKKDQMTVENFVSTGMDLEAEYDIIQAMIDARNEQHITEKE